MANEVKVNCLESELDPTTPHCIEQKCLEHSQDGRQFKIVWNIRYKRLVKIKQSMIYSVSKRNLSFKNAVRSLAIRVKRVPQNWFR